MCLAVKKAHNFELCMLPLYLVFKHASFTGRNRVLRQWWPRQSLRRLYMSLRLCRSRYGLCWQTQQGPLRLVVGGNCTRAAVVSMCSCQRTQQPVCHSPKRRYGERAPARCVREHLKCSACKACQLEGFQVIVINVMLTAGPSALVVKL